MRITSGRLRGRQVIAPQGQTTRPTSDRVREAVFNTLVHASWAPVLEGARILDAFAGSGAMGIEALSLGAAYGLFVDADDMAIRTLKQNLKTLKLEAVSDVERKDTTKLKPNESQAFDIIFIDPPYHKGLGERFIEMVHSGNWLSENGVIVFERGVGEGIFTSPMWQIINTKIYGAAQIVYLTRKINTQYVYVLIEDFHKNAAKVIILTHC